MSCLSEKTPKVANYLAVKSMKFKMPKNQVKTFTELYLDRNNTDQFPTDEQFIAFVEQLEDEKNQFEDIPLKSKQEQLDFLEALFYKIMLQGTKGQPLTRSFINKNLTKVLDDNIKRNLAKFNLVDIQNNYPYLKNLLIETRLHAIDVSLEEEEIEDRNSSVESKSSIMFNPVEQAKDEVKYLYKSLFSEKSIFGLNLPYDYSKAMTQTLNLLGGTTTFDQQIQLILNSDLPFKQQLLDRLGIIDGKPQNLIIYKDLRTSFFEQFSKAKGEFHITDIGWQGNTYEATTSAFKLNIIDETKSRFLKSDFVSVNSKGKYVISKAHELSNNPLMFLQQLGFDITKNEMSPEVTKAAEKIIPIVKNVGRQISWLDDKFLKGKDYEIKGYLSTITDALVEKAKKDSPNMIRNATGEKQSAVHNHNFFTRKFSRLRNGLLTPLTWLEKNISDGLFNYTIISGATAAQEKENFSKLGIVDLYNVAITNMFSNSNFVFSLPQTSDKTLQNGISLKRNKSLDVYGKVITEEAFMSNFVYNGSNPKEFVETLYSEFEKDYAAKPPKKFTENFTMPIVFWEQMFNTNYNDSDEIPSIEEFADNFNKYINDQTTILYQDFLKNGIIEEGTTRNNKPYLKTKIPTNIITSKFDSNFKNLNKEKQEAVLKKVLNAYVFNSVFYGTQLAKFNYGTITASKSPEDFFKRTPSAIAETRSPNLSPEMIDYINSHRLPGMAKFPSISKLRIKIHAETKEPSNKEIIDLTGGKDSAYNKNNVDDAQGKIHFGIYKEINELINNWSDLQEKVYQKLLKNQKLEGEELKVVFPPLKPVAFDLIDDEGNQIPIYLKLSAYPLIPSAILGTMNETTNNMMENNGIALVGPDSMIKKARPNTKNQPEYKKGEATFFDNSTFEIRTEGFGIQVDINEHKGFKQLQGTQIRKLILSNLVDNGVPRKEAGKWLADNKETLKKLSDIETEDLLKKVKTAGKGLKQLLLTEVKKRGASTNTIDAVEFLFKDDGKFIDTAPNNTKLMNIINSLVTNNIVKLYTKGATLVQVSQAGWELKPNSTIETPTGIDFVNNEAKQKYIDNKGLGFLTWKEKGETIGAAEIILPAKYKQFTKKDKKGNYVIDDEKILINIGYRIPTQGLNSCLQLKVVGFLPSYMDQIVIMPKEITTQGGSDFDVDKLNLYIPNTRKYKGKTIFVDQSVVDNAKEMFNDIVARKADIKDKQELDAKKNQLKTDTKNFENLIEDNLDINYTEEELDELSTELELDFDSFKRKLEKESLQNELITQAVDILNNGKLTLKQLLTPNSSNILNDLEKKLYGKESKFNYGTLFTPKTLVEITEQMYAAKALVGVFASQSVHHVLGQIVGLSIQTSRPFYFPHNKMEDGTPSLSGVYKKDLNGNDTETLISEMLGNQYLTAAVDAAKDPFLFTLGVNGTTSDMVSLMERLGCPTDYIMEMLKQPIIKEYLQIVSNNNSMSFKFNRAVQKKDKNILQLLTKNNIFNSEYLAVTKKSENANELKAARFAKGQIDLTKELTSAEKGMILDDFLFLLDGGKLLRASIANTKFDTNGGGKDIIQTVLIKKNYDDFIEYSQDYENVYTLHTKNGDYSNLIEDTFLKSFKDNMYEATETLYNNMSLLTMNDAVAQIMYKFNAPIYDRLNKKGIVKNKLNDQDSSLLYESILNYIVQNAQGLNENLFIGNQSVANRILNIQKDIRHPLHNMYLFNELFSVTLSDNDKVPGLVLLKDKFIDNYKQEAIEKEFTELQKFDPQLFKDLINISFFQSGFTQSPASFRQFLPSKSLMPILQDSLAKFSNGLSTIQFNNIVNKIGANIGTKLKNLQTVRLSPGEKFNSPTSFTFDKCEGKDLIKVYSAEGKKSMCYQLDSVLDDIYYYNPIPLKNIKSFFVNYTSTETNINTDVVEDEINTENFYSEDMAIPYPSQTEKWNGISKPTKMKDGIYTLKDGIVYVDGKIATKDQQDKYNMRCIMSDNYTTPTFVEYKGEKYYFLPKLQPTDKVEVFTSTLEKVSENIRSFIASTYNIRIKELQKEIALKNC